MTVSSMIPPSSLRITERVEEKGSSEESEDGTRCSMNSVAVEPSTLWDNMNRVRKKYSDKS